MNDTKLRKCNMCFSIYSNKREHCPTCGCLTLHGITINHESMRLISRRMHKSVSKTYPNVEAN